MPHQQEAFASSLHIQFFVHVSGKKQPRANWPIVRHLSPLQSALQVGAQVSEKTLESPLDCKEIQPVHPKGDQS